MIYVHLLAVMLIVAAGLFFCLKDRKLELNFGLVFVGFGVLYITGPLVAAVLGQLDKDYVLSNVGLLYMAAITSLAFMLGYGLFFRKEKSPVETSGALEGIDYKRAKIFMTFFSGVVVAVKMYTVFAIGINQFVAVGKGQMKMVLSQNYAVGNLIGMVGYPLMILALELHFARKKTEKDIFFLILALITTAATLFEAIVQLDRSTVLLVVLPWIYVLAKNKVIQIWKIIVFGVVMFLAMLVWKEVVVAVFNSDLTIADTIAIAWPSEFFVWFEVWTDIIREFKKGILSYRYGATYLSAIESIFNPLFQNYQSLSSWYMEHFYPLEYAKGNGRAFSMIVEAYYNFGYVFMPFAFFPMGIIVKAIERKKYSIYWGSFCALFAGFTYKFYRSELYSVVKLSFWTWAVPLFGMWILISLKREDLEAFIEKIKNRERN